MAEATKIQWTDATFNPWIGCTRVSPGCDDCYAARSTPARTHGIEWGAGQPRHRTSAETWGHPAAWNKRQFYECLDCGARFAPPGRKEGFVTCPGCSKHGGRMAYDEEDGSRVKRVRRRVFCASLADVFDNEVDPAWRMDLFKLIAETPNLDWLVLTKRIGNVMSMCSTDSLMFDALQHVWLGATVVNQEEADRDIPKLLSIPARVRFLSCEPLLGPISFEGMWVPHKDVRIHENMLEALDWVIVGGESGASARQLHVEWVESMIAQCAALEVPCLVKQLGHRPLWTGTHAVGHGGTVHKLPKPWTAPYGLKDPKGGDINEWPERLRVREFPVTA